jgi:HAD superfamily hydrolase (TIGR01509 family)
MIKVVVFDFDGVLFKSNDVHVKLWEKVMKRYGVDSKITEKIITESFGKSYEEIVEKLMPKEHMSKLEEILREFLKEITSPEYPKKFKVVDGAKKFIEELRSEGIRTAIATGNKKFVMELWLKELSFLRLFDMIITPEDVKHGKPHPDMLLKALTFFGINRKEMIYVGDAKDDMEMGKAAGVTTVAVLTGAMNRKEAEEERADIILEKITDLKV